MSDWLLLQLADSAFPAGGFAHSAGLEASAQLGRVRSADDLRAFAGEALWQTGWGALPFVGAGFDAANDEAALEGVDALADAFLSSHVARRASRTQGRAFVATAASVFANEAIARLDERVRVRAGHHAPSFGAVLRHLDASRDDAQRVFLHLAARGVLSAGVRLGVTGPRAAQALQRELAPLLDDVIARCASLTLDELAQPAPLLELCGALHDGLYSRLFQS